MQLAKKEYAMPKSAPLQPPTIHRAPDRLPGGTLTESNDIARTADQATSYEQSDPLLTTRESAAHLNVSKSYLDKLRVYGGGPEFLRPSPRKILYRRSVLDRWIHERRFGSTSEYQR